MPARNSKQTKEYLNVTSFWFSLVTTPDYSGVLDCLLSYTTKEPGLDGGEREFCVFFVRFVARYMVMKNTAHHKGQNDLAIPLYELICGSFIDPFRSFLYL